MLVNKKITQAIALSSLFIMGVYTFGFTALSLSSGIVTPVLAAVSSYTAHDFAQYCNDHPDTCVRSNFSTDVAVLTCPNNLVPDQIFVHAGNGQTVYVLPQDGFTYVIDGSTVTVTRTTFQQAISWVGMTCKAAPSASPSQSPSVSPSASPSVSPSASPSESPSASPSESPSASPSESPSASPSESPSASPSESPSASPSESPSVSPSPSPSTSPSPAESASPTPAPSDNNSNNSGSVNGDNTSSDNSGDRGGAVLGDYAGTGVVQDVIMNLVGSIGGLTTAIGTVLYGKKKKTSKK